MLVAFGLALLPFASVALPGSAVSRQIYGTVLATICGLAALLLFEEHLLSRSGPRLLGLTGTYLAAMAMAIAWATAYSRGVTVGASFFPARIGWELTLGGGLALSLATPDRMWKWISARLAGNALSYTLVAAGTALLLGATAVPLAEVLGALLPPHPGQVGLDGASLSAGLIALAAQVGLLTLSTVRWSRLTSTSRWALGTCWAAAGGFLLAILGGSSFTLGSSLGLGETGIGIAILLTVASSGLYSGDHEQLMLEMAEREVLRQVATAQHPGESPDQTAQRICHELVRVRGTAIAQVMSLSGRGAAVPVATYPDAPAGFPAPNYVALPPSRERALRERAAAGPWIQRCAEAAAHADDPELRDYWQAHQRCGIHAFAYAPIRSGGRLLGLLLTGAGGRDPDEAARYLTEILPSLVDFAAIASGALGPLLDRRAATEGGAEEVLRALDQDSFHPVFQPIVDLVSREPVGYEALTRFEGGLAPDRAFAIAAEHGLQARLELACVRKALQMGRRLLDEGQFLAVNVSPEVVVGHLDSLGRSLRAWPHPSVVEITEHSVVSDYAELRSCTARLGPRTRLAVDDAGAGYASLRHILELRPQFVKLDISLVQGMTADPAREALVAGIQHFAERSDCRLIAEGVETGEEFRKLQQIGVELGQGYLLGRPQEVSELKRSA